LLIDRGRQAVIPSDTSRLPRGILARGEDRMAIETLYGSLNVVITKITIATDQER